MRKPAHADPGATLFAVKVFEKGSRKAILEAEGLDPSNIAKTVSDHKVIKPHEKANVRRKLRDSLKALQNRTIPNMTDLQLDIGGRRVRVKAS